MRRLRVYDGSSVVLRPEVIDPILRKHLCDWVFPRGRSSMPDSSIGESE